jgi:signal transduction histidine kinase
MRTDDGTLTVDPVISRLLGFDAAETTLGLADWLARVHPDERERIRRQALAPWGENEALRESEFRVCPGNYGCRWLLARGKAVETAPGKGVVVGTVVDITEIKTATESIRALTGQLIAAQESERARIARDLHDNVAQDLSTLKISFETLLDTVPGLGDALKDRLDALSRLLGRSISSVRDLALALRPPDLEYLGLVRSLQRLCEDFMAASGLRTSFGAVGLEGITPGHDVAINLYRIAQEALSNARRHSGCDTVSVRLVESHPMLILRVADNGHGFDPERRSGDETGRRGMGLVNMRERAMLLGGSLRVVSAPDQGTTIVASIPYAQEPGSTEDAPTPDC